MYRKVYSQSNKDSIDLSGLNYDYIEIVTTRMNNSGYIRFPYYTNSSDYFRTLINSSKIMSIETSASSIINWTTTIQYTKTTD